MTAVRILGATVATLVLSAATVPFAAEPAVLFHDDFEGDLSAWEVSHPDAMSIVDSGDAVHGKVFNLAPRHLQQHALMRGSETWKAYRVEGQVLFPTDEQNYLGWIYSFTDSGNRVDLGSIYIKGNGSYIRMNPRRDWNPARNLYDEWRVNLTGGDAIVIGEWHRPPGRCSAP